MSSEIGHVVSCGRCSREMGRLDKEELMAFVADEDSPGLCFDCDSSENVLKPVDLMPVELATLSLMARARSYEKMAKEISSARAHEYTGERAPAPGLSSCTNVNGNTKFKGVLENLYDDRICPQCEGLSFNFELYGVHPCITCGDKGSIRVLKKWVVFLIGGVTENA